MAETNRRLGDTDEGHTRPKRSSHSSAGDRPSSTASRLQTGDETVSGAETASRCPGSETEPDSEETAASQGGEHPKPEVAARRGRPLAGAAT